MSEPILFYDPCDNVWANSLLWPLWQCVSQLSAMTLVTMSEPILCCDLCDNVWANSLLWPLWQCLSQFSAMTLVTMSEPILCYDPCDNVWANSRLQPLSPDSLPPLISPNPSPVDNWRLRLWPAYILTETIRLSALCSRRMILVC